MQPEEWRARVPQVADVPVRAGMIVCKRGGEQCEIDQFGCQDCSMIAAFFFGIFREENARANAGIANILIDNFFANRVLLNVSLRIRGRNELNQQDKKYETHIGYYRTNVATIRVNFNEIVKIFLGACSSNVAGC